MHLANCLKFCIYLGLLNFCMKIAHGHEAENSIMCACHLTFSSSTYVQSTSGWQWGELCKNIQLKAINLQCNGSWKKSVIPNPWDYPKFLQLLTKDKLNAIWLECQFLQETDTSNKNSKILLKWNFNCFVTTQSFYEEKRHCYNGSKSFL